MGEWRTVVFPFFFFYLNVRFNSTTPLMWGGGGGREGGALVKLCRDLITHHINTFPKECWWFIAVSLQSFAPNWIASLTPRLSWGRLERVSVTLHGHLFSFFFFCSFCEKERIYRCTADGGNISLKHTWKILQKFNWDLSSLTMQSIDFFSFLLHAMVLNFWRSLPFKVAHKF